MNSTDLLPFVDNLQQAGKIHNLQQVCGTSGCGSVRKQFKLYCFMDCQVFVPRKAHPRLTHNCLEFTFQMLSTCVAIHKMTFLLFSSRLQGPNHPNPGQPYYASAFPRTCYLPNNNKGKKVSIRKLLSLVTQSHTAKITLKFGFPPVLTLDQ